jgi:hypothetical protein
MMRNESNASSKNNPLARALAKYSALSRGGSNYVLEQSADGLFFVDQGSALCPVCIEATALILPSAMETVANRDRP